MNVCSGLVKFFRRSAVAEKSRRPQNRQTRHTASRRLFMEGLEARLALAGELFCGPYPASAEGIEPQLVEVEVGSSCTDSIKFDATNDMNDMANFRP